MTRGLGSDNPATVLVELICSKVLTLASNPVSDPNVLFFGKAVVQYKKGIKNEISTRELS